MKKISPNRIIWPVLISLSVISCQKVIQLKTGNIEPKLVIEGNLSDQYNDCSVILTSSVNINAPTLFKGVPGARVTIQEDQKVPVLLTETVTGYYESDQIRARPGHQYTLRVELDKQIYKSTVRVPQKVALDSLYIIDFHGFGSIRKFANLVFKDPAGVANSYRFLLFKNGLQNSNIFVMNDDYSDGRTINTFLAFFDESDIQRIHSGDTVTVEMQCIDPSVYLYFNSLAQSSTGGNEVVAPGNPISNIEGGALGYFNAFTKQMKTIIVAP